MLIVDYAYIVFRTNFSLPIVIIVSERVVVSGQLVLLRFEPR